MSQVSENRMELALPRTMSVVRDGLLRVERLLSKQLQSDIPIIDEMVRCGGATGGKRFRPILLLLSAHACGGIREHHITLATSVEMIHAATLVHDDIIDGAETRRHVSTINNRWGNQGAVLFGDFLFTQAFYLASLTGYAEACQIIGSSTNRVCEGELQQSDAAGNYETTVDEYFEIISRKTASLCGCATRLGAGFGEQNSQAMEWRRVGEQFGLAFQIVDDVLDYVGDASAVGKTLGTDLDTAKPTLPILLALKKSDDAERANWLSNLSQTKASHDDVRTWLEKTDAIVDSIETAKDLVREATQFTSDQDPRVATAFDELGKFLLARTH